MSKRTFYYLSPKQNEMVAEFHSKTPREAALKAASMGLEESILIAETGQMHVFEGGKVAIEEDKINDYMRSRHISSKPFVRKLASESIDVHIDPKKRDGAAQILSVYRQIVL